MFENRSEGLLVRAQPLEQAEHISRLMVDVRVADGVLLLDADPAWAEAINTVLATKGVRVSELCPIRNSKLEPPTPRDYSVPRGIEACERTATGLIRTGTQWTKLLPRIVENRLDKRNFRTHQEGLVCTQANS